MEPVSM
jgi:hypothetical protein